VATYYINASTGNDTTGSGTAGSPWLTVSKAHTMASDGDTVVLQSTSSTYNHTSALTFTKSLTIQGEEDDASGAVIDGGLSATIGTWLLNTANKLLTIKNLTFQNIINWDSGYGILKIGAASGTTEIALENCIFKSTNQLGAGGVFAASDAAAVIYRLKNVLIDNVHSNAATGSIFQFTGSSSGSKYVYIQNSTLYNNRSSNYVKYVFYNSTFLNRNVYLTNAIVRDEHEAVLFTNNEIDGGGGGTLSIEYSCVSGLDTGTYSPPTLDTGSISSNPLFVDPGNSNFNLRPTSPCLNTGTLI
jgi:hypothetical protein